MRKLKYLICFFTLLAFLFYYQPFFQWMTKPLIVNDHLNKADAIVIFGEDLKTDNTLGPSIPEAMDYGLKLFQEGYANRLILSGGKLQANKNEAPVMYDYALAKGFSPESFFLEQSSQSPKERVRLTGKILAEKNYKSILLLSPPYQSARFKKMFTDKGIRVISTPLPDKKFYTARGQDKIKAFRLVASEYFNKVYYDLLH